MLKLLFFARLREDLGTHEETLELPEGVTSVAALREFLCRRGDNWQTALHRPGLFVAVGQQVAGWETPLQGDEEVAFFPPVTGG
ncbi:molybdopterin converting factor subunit 1 [Aestuariicella hydrocarbonica]|uniref:Molybdopterin synthase sulfur carrier subunit n=1 Tax=Pseudomaricurvus hydrocarbonicus TaxID=1470433 RepID=A0A9E5MM06_9GAMM|nr:molybdopterin converting factor subunit 1 [Aestuariicella hydrocarbonica]NHO65150.1 molybdopterin converting factor subunit 1 [Aestuariicella hydrocarbonica]